MFNLPIFPGTTVGTGLNRFPHCKCLERLSNKITLKYRHDYGHKHDPFWIGWYHVRGMGRAAARNHISRISYVGHLSDELKYNV